MSRYVLNQTAIKYLSLFESVTNSKVKDCFIEQDNQIVSESFLPNQFSQSQQDNQSNQQSVSERVVFVIEEAQAGKAIGKHGRNIKLVENMIKKRVKVIEFNPEISQFIRNALYPVQVNEIKLDGKMVFIVEPDRNNKRVLLGRDSRNIKFLAELVKRYFDIDGIKVINEIVDKKVV